MKSAVILSIGLIFSGFSLWAQQSGPQPPTGLMTDMMEHTARVWVKGYPVNITVDDPNLPAQARYVEINHKSPNLGWIVNDTRIDIQQTACLILVASCKTLLDKDSADMWCSGKLDTDQSVSLPYGGKTLLPGKTYFWKVKTWNNNTPSGFSGIRIFRMAENLTGYGTSHYPLEKTNETPIFGKYNKDNGYFADFGKDAFGRISLTLNVDHGDTLKIILGEAMKNGHIDLNPAGTVRCRTLALPVIAGEHSYTITLPPDIRNTGPNAIRIPDDLGEVLPFRYCEVQGLRDTLKRPLLFRESLHYPFNDDNSYFNSSDTVLNDVWRFCKYSIKATSFAGLYVDGDRERIPYEADALINQLSHYATDREYSLARSTHEYLIDHPNWPTEWILQSVILAWNDYLYTGNDVSLAHFYSDLQAKTLSGLTCANGLISTRTVPQTEKLFQSIHFKGTALHDIVDWPQTGILGLGKNEPGETDGFVFTTYNTVVNCYYYQALNLMARIAKTLGHDHDAIIYACKAENVRLSINKLMFDSIRQVYQDGIETSHASLHSNMFALAFHLVPGAYEKKVLDYIKSRGMACSVYGAQFLADAVYDAGDGQYGLSLLTSTAERSWAHMLYDVGSTITMEAWDQKYKPNLDWNHAWGAAPANIISRKLMGIEALEPGFRKIRIKVQPGHLIKGTIIAPTIRGNVSVTFISNPGKTIYLSVNLPANSSGEIYLPLQGKDPEVVIDGKKSGCSVEQQFIHLPAIGSGIHQITYIFH